MQLIGSEISPIATIAINATFLSERIHNPCFQNVIPQKYHDLIEERINIWSKLLGGEQQLKQRLKWDGLDLTTVRNLLETGDFREDYTLPSWAETLQELIENTSASWLTLEGEDNSLLDSQNTLPFEDFYLPFIRVGRSKLATRLSANSPLVLLSQEAYAALERSLLQQLVNLGTETLLFEFNTFREADPSAKQTIPQESQIIYKTFLKNLLKDGGLAFFTRYPVLGRLIATTIDLWVESTTEFIQRLQQDFSAIEFTFSDQQSLGNVQKIETSLSNHHHGRRSVLAITFSSGIKVVYKPKYLGLDVAFNQLLDWCNHQEISLSFKLTKILNRQGYGWVEFIEHQPCENQAAVQRFYKRAGMLLSLLHVLGASSCDHQNVVASGEFPILIDGDLLMHPVEQSLNESEDWFNYSVLHTGFLPAWEGDTSSANAQDSSVLGNIWPKQINSSRDWKFINTDGMHLAPNTVIIPAGTNVVILDGKTVSPNNYVEEIVTGFEEIYHLLTKNREMLLGEESPLSGLQSLQSRFMLRPTLTYGMVSKRSLSPQYLRNGADYSILIDFLSRHYLMAEENLDFKELLGAETKSLQQLDIPYFTVSCNSNALELASDQTIKHFFKTSSYQRLIAKIKSLDDQDLARQIKLIRGSFYAKYAHLNKNSNALQGNFFQLSSLNPEELLEEAIEIGNSLVASAIHTGDGYNWIDLDYMFKANRYQIQLLDDSLFTGRAGVSLFLAALGKITGEPEFKEVSLAALSPLRQSLKKAQGNGSLLELRLDGIKLGSILGLMGLGGIIYSLVKISQFLQEPALLEDAQQAAKLITADLIAADQKLDIIFGVAGAIMGLLTLYQETGEKALLDKAVACGNHLLSQRTDTAPRAWKANNKTPLTGFSHGAAGNSFSLLHLYAATEDKAYLEGAKEGIEYETSVFDTSVRNWPDFLSLEQSNKIDFRDAWCHGSTGIGLARLGSSSILQTEEIYSDIEVALETSKQYALSSIDVDFLCCGSLGTSELFVVASQKLGNQEWLNTARKQAASVVARAKENGAYAFLPHFTKSVFSPSFFKGSAGVGYQLLRLASPESLPSVLIWE
ncbi:type 2 lanthipeptide synthetase LanM family protein [Moorena producens JHB]|uniref:Type 2 lanthipeptide synthetase LanM family protein n=1 Tax=Moorena producens (strain JHB) TaxID=1454205 RepID=A0A1D9FZU2_MOOP1|nr:type 2 lanthipeptide synthetase LanM family protein [Moorena producens]AOY80876.1 type 2 lanthipeptide synthetase LanM family protein [Moorena producens JHB]